MYSDWDECVLDYMNEIDDIPDIFNPDDEPEDS